MSFIRIRCWAAALTLLGLSLTVALAREPLPAGPMPEAGAGRIERITVEGTAQVPGRMLDVWLPPGYPDAAPYAIALMFDGQMLFDARVTWNRQEWRADDTAAMLQSAGLVRPFVIVGVPNAGPDRHAEYFPQRPFEALPTAVQKALRDEARRGDAPLFHRNPYSDAFLDWLSDEALPTVAARFQVSTERKDRVLIGASMGGLIALYAVTSKPTQWGGSGSLSTHWPGIFPRAENPVPEAFFADLREHLPSPGRHRLYFDHGDATLDALYPPLQAQVDRIGVERGWAFPMWRSRSFPGADHSEEAWAARLDGVFRFLLPPREPRKP